MAGETQSNSGIGGENDFSTYENFEFEPKISENFADKTNEGLVSVIVPVYHIPQEYLNCCINSLINQTYKKIEIILIDDGSPDDCGKICDFFAEKYSNIIVIHQENKGVSVARNNGILAARGEYLMFVDPDDWIERDCIEIAIQEIKLQNVDLLLFQYCREKNNQTEILDKKNSKKLSHMDLIHIQMDLIAGTDIYGGGPKPPWGKLIRKSVITFNNVMFPVGLKKSQDIVFNLYLDEFVNEAYYLDYVGYHYRVHQDSVSNRYNEEILCIIFRILKEYAEFIQIYHNNDENFKICLGIWTIADIKLLEQLYIFHPESHLKKNEVFEILDYYFNNELVSEYVKYCKLKYFSGWKKKFRYILLKRKHYNLYYIYCKRIRYRNRS